MPRLVAISRTQHAGRRWLPYTSYAFAAGDALAPLVAAELPAATLRLPIGFAARDGAFVPVAVQGLAPGRNLFVAPDGRWLGGYVPAAYRSHPFHLAKSAAGPEVLCFDEDSVLLAADGAGGEPFFADDGQPAARIVEVLAFLRTLEAGRRATAQICAALHRHGVLQPWPITVKGEAGEQRVDGLFRIDEAAFNALPAEALLELRAAGALPVVYCQLLSMQCLPVLGQLAAAHARLAAAPARAPAPAAQPDPDFFSRSETISFGGLT